MKLGMVLMYISAHRESLVIYCEFIRLHTEKKEHRKPYGGLDWDLFHQDFERFKSLCLQRGRCS